MHRFRRHPQTTAGGILALFSVLAIIAGHADVHGWNGALAAALKDPALWTATGAALAGLAAADAKEE